ncbi:MAG TPA: dipeptide epimerase [Actinomycetota bacterium]|nr:dipeptide epimerase [Actinomycetota bacterium]
MPADWSRESWELEVTQLDLELAERFTIARETWTVARNVFVTLRFASVSGVGEVNPDPYLGETVDSVAAQLEAIDPRSLENPFNLEGILEILPAGSARAALDIALHDLAGKIAGLSITKLLGVKGRVPAPTSLTLPIAEIDKMVERARSLADHPVLKMKVGFDGDVDAVSKVREVFPGTLRIDANTGWNEEEAKKRLKELEALDIELCEQPIPIGDYDALGRVTESTSIPVFADEDVKTSRDVAALAGVVDGVNLKLRKTGGLREAMRAIATARAHDLKVMLGTDLVSGVAATAEAHLAPLVDHLDIDGPLLLKEDPFPGVTYDKGRITVPDLPGLGVRGAPA